jgi:hypothetical protein
LKGFLMGVPVNSPAPIQALVYPNPSTDRFNVELSGVLDAGTEQTVSVTDAYGRQVYTEKMQPGSFSLNAAAWSKGLYFMRVGQGNKTICRARLLLVR